MYCACCSAQVAQKLVFFLVQKSNQQALRAYCPNIYALQHTVNDTGSKHLFAKWSAGFDLYHPAGSVIDACEEFFWTKVHTINCFVSDKVTSQTEWDKHF